MAFLLLTVVTQIGGTALLLCLPAFRLATKRVRSPVARRAAYAGIFLIAYGFASLAAIPVAGLFGRVPLPCGFAATGGLEPYNVLTCLLNRHYTTKQAAQALQNLATGFSRAAAGAPVAYLDAGFPFSWGIPMLPHLSHGDGRKVDLALFYEGATPSPSPIGYWGFVQPRPGDPRPCAGREGAFRWDMAWLQPLIGPARLDGVRTRALLSILSDDPRVKRIFIEPHLAARLGVEHPKLRFQGCAAARHDDHIHIEFR